MQAGDMSSKIVDIQISKNLNELKYQLEDYVNSFDNQRTYSSIDYLTPYEYRTNTLKKVVSFTVDNPKSYNQN